MSDGSAHMWPQRLDLKMYIKYLWSKGLFLLFSAPMGPGIEPSVMEVTAQCLLI